MDLFWGFFDGVLWFYEIKENMCRRQRYSLINKEFGRVSVPNCSTCFWQSLQWCSSRLWDSSRKVSRDSLHQPVLRWQTENQFQTLPLRWDVIHETRSWEMSVTQTQRRKKSAQTRRGWSRLSRSWRRFYIRHPAPVATVMRCGQTCIWEICKYPVHYLTLHVCPNCYLHND